MFSRHRWPLVGLPIWLFIVPLFVIRGMGELEPKVELVANSTDQSLKIICIKDPKAYCQDKEEGMKFSDGCRECQCRSKDAFCKTASCAISVPVTTTPEEYCARILKENAKAEKNKLLVETSSFDEHLFGGLRADKSNHVDDKQSVNQTALHPWRSDKFDRPPFAEAPFQHGPPEPDHIPKPMFRVHRPFNGPFHGPGPHRAANGPEHGPRPLAEPFNPAARLGEIQGMPLDRMPPGPQGREPFMRKFEDADRPMPRQHSDAGPETESPVNQPPPPPPKPTVAWQQSTTPFANDQKADTHNATANKKAKSTNKFSDIFKQLLGFDKTKKSSTTEKPDKKHMDAPDPHHRSREPFRPMGRDDRAPFNEHRRPQPHDLHTPQAERDRIRPFEGPGHSMPDARPFPLGPPTPHEPSWPGDVLDRFGSRGQPPMEWDPENVEVMRKPYAYDQGPWFHPPHLKGFADRNSPGRNHEWYGSDRPRENMHGPRRHVAEAEDMVKDEAQHHVGMNIVPRNATIEVPAGSFLLMARIIRAPSEENTKASVVATTGEDEDSDDYSFGSSHAPSTEWMKKFRQLQNDLEMYKARYRTCETYRQRMRYVLQMQLNQAHNLGHPSKALLTTMTPLLVGAAAWWYQPI